MTPLTPSTRASALRLPLRKRARTQLADPLKLRHLIQRQFQLETTALEKAVDRYKTMGARASGAQGDNGAATEAGAGAGWRAVRARAGAFF